MTAKNLNITQQTHIKKLILMCIIYLSRTPNLSRTYDIEASFTPIPKGCPYLSCGLN